MDRILERHDDVGTLGVYLYEKEGVLYIDKQCTKEATVEDAQYAFLRRGVVVCEDGSMSEITSFSENESAANSISYGASASSGSSGSTTPTLYYLRDPNSGNNTLYTSISEDGSNVVLATCDDVINAFYQGGAVQTDFYGETFGKVDAISYNQYESTDDDDKPIMVRRCIAVLAVPSLQSGAVIGGKFEYVIVHEELPI